MIRRIVRQASTIKSSDEAKEVSAPSGDEPYQQAAETIRATAKWLVTAFAGVGGILIAGIPLTGLGRLRSAPLIVALGAITVALVAIAYIIPRVSRVFTAKYITLADLAYQAFPRSTSRLARWHVKRRITPISNAVDESRDELYGAEAASLADLNKRITDVNEDLRSFGSRPQSLTAQSSLAAAAKRVVAFANYEDVRQTFRRLYRPMAVAATVVAVGVITFAFAVGSATSVANVTSPAPVRLSLIEGAKDWQSLLGAGCDISRVDAVAISGTFSEPDVITTGTKGCEVVRLRITKSLGVAVPVVGTPTPSASPTATR
jgi:hypothetical protein